MKIGIDATSLCRKLTGLEKYTYGLVESLLRYDERNRYFVFFRKHIPSELEEVCRGHMLICSPFKHQVPTEQVWLPYAKMKYGLDLMLFPAFPPGFFVPGDFVYVLHDANIWKHKRSLSWKGKFYFKPLSLIAVKRAANLMTVSESAREDICRYAKVAESKVVCIGNSIRPHFKVLGDKTFSERVRAEHGLPERFLLFVGSIEPRKNLTALVKAFKVIVDKNLLPGYCLVLAGRKAWGFKSLVDHVRKAGLEERVLFTGYLPEEELVALYNMARVCVSPSVYEGFGLPVVEAMACNCPVVASDIQVNRELFGSAVILSDTVDTDAFAEDIAGACIDEKLREDLKKRGLEKVTDFNWVDISKKAVRALELSGKTREGVS